MSDQQEKSANKLKGGKPSNKLGAIGAVLGLLAVLGVGGLAAWNFKVYQANQALESKLASQEALQSEQEAGFQKAVNDLKQLNIAQQKAFKELQNQVQVQQQRLQGMSGQYDWRLSEAKYLVTIAIERLKTLGDPLTVIQQLKAASSRLKQVGDPRTLPAREILTQDIANLEMLSVPDKTELWLEVGALAHYVKNLKIYSIQDSIGRNPELKEAEENEQTSKSNWKSALKDSWSEIKQLVKVRDFDADTLSLTLTKEEYEQLNQAIILQISQAQWAILNEAKDVYEQSLLNVKEWLEKFYKQDEAWQTTMKHLKEAQAKFVKKIDLDISKGLDAINKLIDELATAFLNKEPNQPEDKV